MVKDTTLKETKRHSCRRLRKVLILVSFLGVVMVILSLVLKSVIDRVFRNKIDENLILRPGSPTFKAWRKSTVPIHSKYYFFNVLNAEEVRQGEKPIVEERGPYSYIAHTEKINITWHDENATVTYDEKTWYVFDRDSSCTSCDPFNDEVTTVNIPLVTVAEMFKTYPDYFDWKRLVSILLERFAETLFITRNVHDLLWGYKDPLLDEIVKLREKHPRLRPFIPGVNPMVLLQPNNTLQGITTVNTGAEDIHYLEMWKSWKGHDKLDIWLTEFANMLNGTDGRQFAPRVAVTDTLYFFVIQLCRSLYVTYDHRVQDQNIEAFRFVIPPELFMNGTANPNNAAFYPQGFLPTGILDPRKCQGGEVMAPVFISAPHFYLGDPRLVEAVEGIKPIKEEHELSFDVEPNLGVPLTNAIRLQVTVFIEPVKDITETSGVRRIYMPIMWFEESASLDSDTTALFRNKILNPMKVCHDIEIALISVGVLFLLPGFAVLCQIMRTKKRLMFCCITEERLPLINDDEGMKRNNNLEDKN